MLFDEGLAHSDLPLICACVGSPLEAGGIFLPTGTRENATRHCQMCVGGGEAWLQKLLLQAHALWSVSVCVCVWEDQRLPPWSDGEGWGCRWNKR